MSDDEFNIWQKKFVIGIFIAILGGNFGTVLNAVNPTVRSDPFTGTQGDMLERRIDQIEARLVVIAYRLEKGKSREHDAIVDLEKRCNKLERECVMRGDR